LFATILINILSVTWPENTSKIFGDFENTYKLLYGKGLQERYFQRQFKGFIVGYRFVIFRL